MYNFTDGSICETIPDQLQHTSQHQDQDILQCKNATTVVSWRSDYVYIVYNVKCINNRSQSTVLREAHGLKVSFVACFSTLKRDVFVNLISRSSVYFTLFIFYRSLELRIWIKSLWASRVLQQMCVTILSLLCVLVLISKYCLGVKTI